MQFWSRVAESPRIVVDFATDKFFNDLPWALAAGGIVIGSIFVMLVIIKITEILTRSQSTDRYFYSKGGFQQRATHTSKSLIRLAGITLAMASLFFGFSLASSTLGVNFWTLILSFGIVAIIITYAFGSALRHAGAFLAIALSLKIEEGAVVTIGNVRGRILAIHLLCVKMQDITDLEARLRAPADNIPPKEIYVPTAQFIDAVVWRDYEAQMKIEELIADTTTRWTTPKSRYPTTVPYQKILL